MKYQILFITITALFISCSNDKKATETEKHFSSLKSDILLESNGINTQEYKTLFISGKSLLKGIVTYKVTNNKGEEIHCETFPAKQLIQDDYKSANSTLQEQHLREVVDGYFAVEQNIAVAHLY